MAIPDPTAPKHALRKQMRQAFRENPHDPTAVCVALDAWLAARPELRTIAVYSPLPGEVDPGKAVAGLPERRWVYPRVDGDHLTFHTGEDLAEGSFGIMEPAVGSPEVPVEEIDAFLCPGLAFDRNGGRLGRGRGVYDRMLARAREDAVKIGLCHDFQVVEDTFSEGHDVRMDEVIVGEANIEHRTPNIEHRREEKFGEG